MALETLFVQLILQVWWVRATLKAAGRPERPISCCGERQYSNQAIKRSKPRALAHRCLYQCYQGKGNRTQET